MENPIKMDDLGPPHYFWKQPYSLIFLMGHCCASQCQAITRKACERNAVDACQNFQLRTGGSFSTPNRKFFADICIDSEHYIAVYT